MHRFVIAAKQAINDATMEMDIAIGAADEYGKRFNMPLAYNAKADKGSWQRMRWVLKQVFK